MFSKQKPDDGTPARETWMTELPPEHSTAHNLMAGLVSRKFRKDAGGSTGGDRSEWTDTPADRERKEAVGDLLVMSSLCPLEHLNVPPRTSECAPRCSKNMNTF